MFLNNYNEFIFFISLLKLEKIAFMKKISFFVFILIGFMACQPKDKQAPLIFLKGDNPYIVSLGKFFKDPGATVEDNKDKDITNKLIMTHNVEINGPANGDGTTKRTGTYTVTYTCKDAAGNTGTATRTVIVKNDVEQYATRYELTVNATNASIVKDTVVSSIDLSVDATTNMKLWFPKMGAKQGFRIYGMISWESDNYYHITIPDQKVPFFENNVRYLYGVTNANSTQFIQDSKIIDSIDPSFDIKYYLYKYKYSPYGTVTWNDSLWEVIKNDVVIDHYERF